MRHVEHFFIFLLLSEILETHLSKGIESGYRYHSEYGQRELSMVWRDLAKSANSLLNEYHIDETIPDTIDFIQNEQIFNASDYWRDWFRTKR